MAELLNKLKSNKAKKPFRRWMLVINNPTSKECWAIADLAHSPKISGLMWSVENPHNNKDNEPENKTEHFHIYLATKNSIRAASLKKLLPRAHIEPAHKTALACCRYVAKEGFYLTFGNLPNLESGKHRGSRDSSKSKAEELAREEAVKAMKEGKLRMKDLTPEQLLDKKLISGLKEARNMTLGPRRPDLHVCVFITPTGWGKSFAVNDTFDDIAEVDISSQEWFLNPEAEVMLFDEFCGQIRVTKMLRYLDEYKVSLPVKGGHCPCYFKAVFICSNTSPNEWYMTTDPKTGETKSSIPDDVRKALYRRLGYPLPNLNRETHIYDPMFTSMADARKDMMQICQRIYKDIHKDTSQEQISDDEEQPVVDQTDRQKTAPIILDDGEDSQIHHVIVEDDEDDVQMVQPPSKLRRMDAQPSLQPITDSVQVEHEVLVSESPSPDDDDDDFEEVLQHGL